MGNHEFCTRCGENDFHLGQSCEEAYPEKFTVRGTLISKEEAEAARVRVEEKRWKSKINSAVSEWVEYLVSVDVPIETAREWVLNDIKKEVESEKWFYGAVRKMVLRRSRALPD